MARLLYLPFLLVWALPVVIGQWLIGWRMLWRWRSVWMPLVPILTVYLSLADAVAINALIWRFDAHALIGVWIGSVPIEEVLFYCFTSAMLAQGFVLFWAGSRRHARPTTPITTSSGASGCGTDRARVPRDTRSKTRDDADQPSWPAPLRCVARVVNAYPASQRVAGDDHQQHRQHQAQHRRADHQAEAEA